ncbi:dihydrodipicolinate synthase family protein [Membranihabitans maritimus]|uniref:dihydrodipicolinate synthase family protein n=1 Tax=Membranihabitans maritimus TaxID=2904244 RepID=UPI001F02975B|nr:dihydrodipicolinate synthase family protein [Membranihabitans maritimus]
MSSIERRKFIKIAAISGAGLLTGSAYATSSYFNNSKDKIQELPGGAYAVMMTPFTKDLKIDYPALKELINWYERAGIRGFFANCASSEMYDLSPEERLNLTRFVVENSKVPVLSTGTFSDDVRENASFIKKIHDTGVDGVVIITSVIVGKDASDQDFANSIMELVNETEGIPLGIYECPSPYKRLVSPELLGKISDTGRFIYLKDTSCDAETVRQKIKACKGSKLGLYNAHTPDILDSLRHDGAGSSTIASNYYPELYAYLCKNANKKGKKEEVELVNDFILRNEKVIGKKYKISAKYFMKIRGLPVNVNSRTYNGALDDSDEKRLQNLWSELQMLAEKVNITLA